MYYSDMSDLPLAASSKVSGVSAATCNLRYRLQYSVPRLPVYIVCCYAVIGHGVVNVGFDMRT